MTTLSSIINRAYRESQILDINRPPSVDQEAEALEMLRGILRRYQRVPVFTVWLGDFTNLKRQRGEIFRSFNRMVQNIALPQDVYLNVNADQPYEVYLPCDPGDGARVNVIDVNNSFSTNPITLNSNGNLINGALTESLSTNGQRIEYIYRRELAEWLTVVTDPIASSNIPYDQMFDDMFVIELAMRLNPRYSDTMSELSLAAYQTILLQFKGRYMSQSSSAAPDILWDASGTNTLASSDQGYI